MIAPHARLSGHWTRRRLNINTVDSSLCYNRPLVTKESNSTKNGKNISRKGAKCAKKCWIICFLKSGLKDFLGVLCAFARDAFKFLLFDSGLSGLGQSK
jgi:hypothetical protein